MIRCFGAVPALTLAALTIAGAVRAEGDSSAANWAESRIEEQLSALETPRLAGRYGDAAACRKDFSVDAIVRAAQSGAMIEDLGPDMDYVAQYSYRYYTCAAFAAGSDRVCAPLAVFDHFARPHPLYECERYSKELAHVHALMTGASDAPALCRASLTHPEDIEFRPADIGTVCAMEASERSDPEGLCRRLGPYFVKPGQFVKCRAWFLSMAGDDAGCREMGDNDVRERCYAYAAFHRARASGDPSACGSSAICRLFMGGGAASCEDYSRKIAARVCRRVPAANARRAREIAALARAFTLADHELQALSPGLDQDAGRRRLEALRRRFDADVGAFQNVSSGGSK